MADMRDPNRDFRDPNRLDDGYVAPRTGSSGAWIIGAIAVVVVILVALGMGRSGNQTASVPSTPPTTTGQAPTPLSPPSTPQVSPQPSAPAGNTTAPAAPAQ